MNTSPDHYDVVIVGARCAGAATALLLARAGLKVLAVERQPRGSDTISTHALMRGAVLQLRRWGLVPVLAAQGTPQIQATHFHYGSESIRIAIKQQQDVGYLLAPRRTILDAVLVDAAEAAGADIRHGVSLSGLQFDSRGRVVGAALTQPGNGVSHVTSGLVIGADGRQSTVARFVAAETYRQGRSASGLVYGYFEGLPDSGLHWHFGCGTAAGIVPTNHGQHCVFAAVPQHRFASTFRGDIGRGFFSVLAACSPDLADDVRQARLAGRLRGFAGVGGFFRHAHGPGWALIGDAGYFKDPLTAHGITDALRDAQLLAQAVLRGGECAMSAYQEERDALSLPLFELTESIASFDWTLDEVRSLHGRLSAAMNLEAAALARQPDPPIHPAASKENVMDSNDSPWARTIGGRPHIGAMATRTRRTSMHDVEMFTEMTGDHNPVHYDLELARNLPFGGLIVQGGVTTGLLNAVVAEDLPGPGSVFLETNWRFVKAVQVGEEICAAVEVKHVRDDKPICRIETTVRNASGEMCVLGTATTYTMPLKPSWAGDALEKIA